jgi:hypothetical protein
MQERAVTHLGAAEKASERGYLGEDRNLAEM